MSGRSTFSRPQSLLLRLGLTLVLLGYFIVWLPQPVVGLSFIGLELGEWVKFLPAVQGGELFTDRHLFYLPPVTLGLIILAWTTAWPLSWQARVGRALAVAIAALALPSIDVVRFESAAQWSLRVVIVVLVALFALGLELKLLRNASNPSRFTLAMICLVLSLLGAALPTWAYLVVRPAVVELVAGPVGVGIGVWLNALGFTLVSIVALSRLYHGRPTTSTAG